MHWYQNDSNKSVQLFWVNRLLWFSWVAVATIYPMKLTGSQISGTINILWKLNLKEWENVNAPLNVCIQRETTSLLWTINLVMARKTHDLSKRQECSWTLHHVICIAFLIVSMACLWYQTHKPQWYPWKWLQIHLKILWIYYEYIHRIFIVFHFIVMWPPKEKEKMKKLVKKRH